MPSFQEDYGCDMEFVTASRPLSRMYIGRALYHVFATILRERKLLPEAAFKTVALRHNKNYRFRALDPMNSIGRRCLEKFIGVQKAIDEGYFRELILVVSENDDDSNDAIEVFSWKVSYSGDGNLSAEFGDGADKVFANLRFHGDKYIEEKTKLIVLLAKDVCRKRLSALPGNAYATFRITYTEGTPHGYQAAGFERTESLYNLQESAQSLNMGYLATPTEKMLLSVSSCFLTEDTKKGFQQVIDSKFGDNAEELSMENMRLDNTVNEEMNKSENSALLSPRPAPSFVLTPQRTPGRRSQKRLSPPDDEGKCRKSPRLQRMDPARNPCLKTPSFSSNIVEDDPLFAKIERKRSSEEARQRGR